MCGTPQKAAASRFAGNPNEVLNKVIHRHLDRSQLFSRIQNLAAKFKFYFNFEAFDGPTMRAVPRRHAASTQLDCIAS
ncbi:hypothetical protein P3T18_002183 [Paraburkholderia sp. GAS199]